LGREVVFYFILECVCVCVWETERMVWRGRKEQGGKKAMGPKMGS